MTEIAAVTPSDTNLTLAENAGPATISRGIMTYDIGGPDTGVTTMDFSDFLDMINPLQHIPVLSSLYRDATGEAISPVSRIAGDALYGSIMGIASAGVSALAAVGGEVFAANNDGQSPPSTLIAALFGNDNPQSTKLAAASPSIPALQPPSSQLALLQTPATQSPILQMPDLGKPTAVATTAKPAPYQPTAEQIAEAQEAAKSSPISAAAAKAAGTTSDPSLGLALNRSKPAYGGVMDTSMMQNALQNQTLALALANGKNTMQSEHDVRNSRFASSPSSAATPSPSAANTPSSAVANATPPDTVNAGATPSQPVPQALIDDLRAMRGLDKYRSSAQSLPATGSSVDVVN